MERTRKLLSKIAKEIWDKMLCFFDIKTLHCFWTTTHGNLVVRLTEGEFTLHYTTILINEKEGKKHFFYLLVCSVIWWFLLYEEKQQQQQKTYFLI